MAPPGASARRRSANAAHSRHGSLRSRLAGARGRPRTGSRSGDRGGDGGGPGRIRSRPAARFPARRFLRPRLEELYGSHPDPGVRSSAEWVLRRWGTDGKLASLGRGGPHGRSRRGQALVCDQERRLHDGDSTFTDRLHDGVLGGRRAERVRGRERNAPPTNSSITSASSARLRSPRRK